MRTFPAVSIAASAIARAAFLFCAAISFVAVLPAQCNSPTVVPNQTISPGTLPFTDANALSASSVIIGDFTNGRFAPAAPFGTPAAGLNPQPSAGGSGGGGGCGSWILWSPGIYTTTALRAWDVPGLTPRIVRPIQRPRFNPYQAVSNHIFAGNDIASVFTPAVKTFASVLPQGIGPIGDGFVPAHAAQASSRRDAQHLE